LRINSQIQGGFPEGTDNRPPERNLSGMEVEFSDGFLRRETLIEVTEELCVQVEIALYLWNKGRAGLNLRY